MVRVHHILKDGTKLDDITGHVVKLPEVYEVIRQIEERLNREQAAAHHEPDRTA